MTQFLVLSLSSESGGTIKEAVEQNIAPSDRFTVIEERAWLVVFTGTAAGLSEKLGTKDGSKGSLLISSLTDISGYGPNNMIRWMAEHDSNKQ